MSYPRTLWNWVRRQFVDDVPQGDALCEFDCRKLQCTEAEWETCERRLHRAAGELMPEKPVVSETATPSTDPSKTEAGRPAPKA